MDKEILNLEQAMEFFGVSERTMIKLLREERIPARKIGREWRFSRQALINWLGSGSSLEYLNQPEQYRIYSDDTLEIKDILRTIETAANTLQQNKGAVKTLLPEMEENVLLPEKATLRVSFKRQRGLEKLSFKIFWLEKSEANQ